MKRITLLTFFFCFVSVQLFAQIRGTVTDVKKEPLSFVSVYFENSLTGTTTNDQGEYFLNITKKGSYTIVFQYLGYKTLKKKIEVDVFPYNLNVALEEENVQLEEVTINTKENPAIAIIRKTIEAKDQNTDKFAEYTARFYSRGLFRVKNAPKKILGQSLGDLGGGLDSTRSGIIYLSETISRISVRKKPKSFKEKIIASKRSGSNNGISFNRAEEANINFYENAVQVADSKLISPIADGAFSYYRYELEGTFYDKNGILINKIKVIPKREGDRIFKGSIYIVEDDWAIYGVDLITTGKQIGIPFIGELKYKQDYNYSQPNKAWVLISQSIDFDFGFLGFNINGRFSSAYSEYNFEPNFTESSFSNEVLAFEKNATKKDTSFWAKLRPVPLTLEEVKDYKLKDSIKVVRESKPYLDSLDRENNKFNIFKPVTGYTYRNSFKDWSLSLSSPIQSVAYNTVQGWNFNTGLNYFKRVNDDGNWWNTGVQVNYGISDERIRPIFYFNKKWNNLDRPRLGLSAGITTRQFNGRNPITRLINTFSSLLREQNFMKIYEKSFARVDYSQELKNGFYMNTSLEYARRSPLSNTTDYVLFGNDNRSFQTNNPIDPTSNADPFTTHNIWTLNLGANIVFGQKYLSYPDSKFAIGNSKVPEIYVGYRKTFGSGNSEFNSDLFIMRLRQSLSLGNLGGSNYFIRSGIFLSQKDIPFMDFLHANGNQLQLLPSDPKTSFSLLDYYQLSTNDKYAEAHFQHNFKGAVLGRIPLVNLLNYHLVLSAKGLVSGERKPYSEFAVGLDNIGFGKWRFFRIDYVRSNFNGIRNNAFLFGITFGN